MNKRPKGTKYIRVMIDFAIELKEPTDNSAVLDVRKVHAIMHDKAIEMLREIDVHDRVVGTAPGFSSSVSLDKRKRDENGKVAR